MAGRDWINTSFLYLTLPLIFSVVNAYVEESLVKSAHWPTQLMTNTQGAWNIRIRIYRTDPNTPELSVA
jgi:hypothetical protein